MFDFNKFYFLTRCYQNNVSEYKVYQAFLLKYLIEYENKIEKINDLLSDINNHYKIKIPSTIIFNCLSEINKEYPSLLTILNQEVIKVNSIPQKIIKEYENFSNEYKNDTILIRDSFNIYLANSGLNTLTFSELESILTVARDRILNLAITSDINDHTRTFFEWVQLVYKNDDKDDVKNALNKLLFSLLIFSYFSGPSKEEDSKILPMKILLDTNILFYVLGINGKLRKAFAEEFLVFAKENQCTIHVLRPTIEQFKVNFKNSDAFPDIKVYQMYFPTNAFSLTHNTEETIVKFFASHGIKLNVIESSIDENITKYENWSVMANNLKDYKTSKNPMKRDRLTYPGIDHDINLLFESRNYSKYDSIYKTYMPIVTSDIMFTNWVSQILRKNFNSEISGVLPLERFTLLLWIEGKLTTNPKFLAKTWGYIANNISFFSSEMQNSIYKLVNSEVDPSFIDEQYRSRYILIKNKITDIDTDNFSDTNFQDIINAVKELSQEKIAILSETVDNLEAKVEKLNIENIKSISETKELKSALQETSDTLEHYKRKEVKYRTNEDELDMYKRTPLKTAFRLILQELKNFIEMIFRIKA